MTEIRMIVGLGNPGKEYAETRHNIGFQVIDALARMLGVSLRQNKFGGKFADTQFAGQKLILLKPWQYMNLSGQVVATAAGFYHLQPEDIWVVFDDMALDVGRIRVRGQGGAGGHNGLADIIQKLGTNQFPRCRVGIGSSGPHDTVGFVLGKPSPAERESLEEAVSRAQAATLCWLRAGTDMAMNEYNGQ